MVLPVVKLGTLVLKTVAKPIAGRLKTEAGRHENFRQLIINIAQANHRFTTQMQRRLYGHSTDVAIRPLDAEKAVQAAADLFGEIFVFSVAGAAVIFEVHRSAKSEARKEEMRRQEIEAIEQQNMNLAKEVELLKRKMEDLEQQTKARGLAAIFTQKNNQPMAKEDTKPTPAS